MIKISNAEFEVMKVIWNAKEISSTEIINSLSNFDKKQSTIRTLIARLTNKNAIEIINKNARTYTYRALIDEDKYKIEAAKDLIKRLYNNSIEDFIYEYCVNNPTKTNELKQVIQKQQ